MRPGARFVGAAAVVLAMLATSASACQRSVSEPIRILGGVLADSVAGVVIRLLGQAAGEDLGLPLPIEDRPGGSGNLAGERVACAPKDGDTLLMAMIANTINIATGRNVSFNFERDLARISIVASVATVLAANPNLPARSVKELIAPAKQKARQIFFGFREGTCAPGRVRHVHAARHHPVGFGPAEFATYVHQDTDHWAKVVKSIGLKIE